MQDLVDFLKGLGAARLTMVAVTTALIGFFALVIMRVTTPQMATLFTDLSLENSSRIIKDLNRQGIPYELRNEGRVILVPKDKVTQLRMKLAERGLRKGGGVGYEIFNKADARGTTSFAQNVNHLRALEGALARTIRGIDRIQAALVHLVLPERLLFSSETPEPSASIVVRVRDTLEPQQIRSIRHLVASSVNGLKPRIAADLEAVFDVPMQVSAVLGRSKLDFGELLKLGPGTVLELDRRVGEAIDIYVNNRLVARGEVVLVEDKLGVTMTEILKAERT